MAEERTAEKRSRARRVVDMAFLAFWAALLCASLGFKASARFLHWPRWGAHQVRENRDLAAWPGMRGILRRGWGEQVQAWYSDQYAWRSYIIDFYRWVHMEVLHAQVGQQVKGRDGWVFRCGGNWAELEDYMGAFELTPEELADWVALFEGRAQWCRDAGVGYLQVLTPTKARSLPRETLPAHVVAHPGPPTGAQVRAALAGSTAETNVFFMADVYAERGASVGGAEGLFYREDHHPNAYGTWLLYALIVERLGAMLGDDGLAAPPLRDGEGGDGDYCFERDSRLCVRVAGSAMGATDLLPRMGLGGRFPQNAMLVTQPGARRTLVVAHDSFLRFPLAMWHFEKKNVALPVGTGFDRIYSLIHRRLDLRRMEMFLDEDPPAFFVEQFPEIKLTAECAGMQDEWRRAAAFARAMPLPSEAKAAAGTPLVASAVLRNVGGWSPEMRAGRGVEPLAADLFRTSDPPDAPPLATAEVTPGRLRPVYFPAVVLPADVAADGLVVRCGGDEWPARLRLAAP